MMDVHHMRHIVDVAATGALPDVAYDAMRRWDGSSLEHVRSSANHVFRITLDGRPCYLRLTHSLERSREGVAAELDFVQHVSRAGVPVALPLPSVNASLIEDVEADGERYYAIVFQGLTGCEYDAEDLDAAQYRTWGRTLARIHEASRAFPPTTARPSWQDVIRATRDALSAEERPLARRLDTGLAWLQGLSLQPNDTGLLHGDCELDNLVWDDGQCQVLDFESAIYAPYAADIAIALEDVWQIADDQREDWIAAFCDGYREVCPLPAGFPDMAQQMQSLLLATKLGRLILAYRAYPQPVDATLPSWLARMQARHIQWIAAKRAALALESP